MSYWSSVTGLPIIIISSFRTGSTLLAKQLEKEFISRGETPVLFHEPGLASNNGTPKSLINFTEYVKNGNRDYILKVHGHDLIAPSFKNNQWVNKYPDDLKNIRDNAKFLIRIRRNNVIEQCASAYLTSVRQKWHYFVTDRLLANEKIQIDYAHLRHSVSGTLLANAICNMFPNQLFDLDLKYEDIDWSTIDMSLVLIPTPKPSNYEQLLIACAEVLDEIK